MSAHLPVNNKQSAHIPKGVGGVSPHAPLRAPASFHSPLVRAPVPESPPPPAFVRDDSAESSSSASEEDDEEEPTDKAQSNRTAAGASSAIDDLIANLNDVQLAPLDIAQVQTKVTAAPQHEPRPIAAPSTASTAASSKATTDVAPVTYPTASDLIASITVAPAAAAAAAPAATPPAAATALAASVAVNKSAPGRIPKKSESELQSASQSKQPTPLTSAANTSAHGPKPLTSGPRPLSAAPSKPPPTAASSSSSAATIRGTGTQSSSSTSSAGSKSVSLASTTSTSSKLPVIPARFPLPVLSSDSIAENPYLNLSSSALLAEVQKQVSFLNSSTTLLASLPDKGANLFKRLAQALQAYPLIVAKEESDADETMEAKKAPVVTDIAMLHQPAPGSLKIASQSSSSSASSSAAFGSAVTNAHPMFGKMSTMSADAYMPASHSHSNKGSARGMQHGFYGNSSAYSTSSSSSSAFGSSSKKEKVDAVDENDLADLLTSLNQLSVIETKPSFPTATAVSTAPATGAAAFFPSAGPTSAPSEPEQLLIPGLKSSTRLLPHQVQAIRWMMKRESITSEPRGGLIADDCGLGKTLQMMALILHASSISPNLPALPRRITSDPIHAKSSTKATTNFAPYYFPSRATLIICPKAVLNSWKLEFEKHLDPAFLNARGKPLRILTYHGPERKAWSNSKLMAHKCDVVLTTYETVLRESSVKNEQVDEEKSGKKKKKSGDSSSDEDEPVNSKHEHHGLMGVYWRRIVLDECHHMRNPKTETCKSITQLLEGESRWAMSATPLQNSMEDLYSTMAFLRFHPYCEPEKWKEVVTKNPGGQRKGLDVLRTLLQIVALRRTKLDKTPLGTPLIALPPKHFELHVLEFTEREKAFYLELWNGYRKELERKFGIHRKEVAGGSDASAALLNERNKKSLSMSDLLVKLLRLRQTCDHFLLAVEGIRQSTAMMNGKASSKRKQHRDRQMEDVLETACKRISLKLQQQQQQQDVLADDNSDGSSNDESDEVCEICYNPLPSAAHQILTSKCHHSFCFDCLYPLFQEEDNADEDLACPTCDRFLHLKDFKKQIAHNREQQEKTAAAHNDKKKKQAVKTSNMATDDNVDMMAVDYVSLSSSESNLDLLQTAKLEFLRTSLWNIKTSHTTARDKIIVFSQWTSMLDLAQIMLDRQQQIAERQHGKVEFNYTRLDGTQSSKLQHENLLSFQSNSYDSPSIFLISLKAGGTGLNLTAANHLFLLDLWFNPGVEVQAFDRVYRVGQTKPVFIHKCIMKHTVEESLYDLQQSKLQMAFGLLDANRDGAGGGAAMEFKKNQTTGVTLEQLKDIFGLGKR